MPRRATSLPLTLPARSTDAAAYRWLYGAIRHEIVHGQLEPGYRLPATRDLARQYGLSRGTVVAAFELLQAEGYVDSTVGSGTRVSEVAAALVARLGQCGSSTPRPAPTAAALGKGAARDDVAACTPTPRAARSARISRRSTCSRRRRGRRPARASFATRTRTS